MTCSSHVESATKDADDADELPTAALWTSCGLWKARMSDPAQGGRRVGLRSSDRVATLLLQVRFGLGGSVEIGEPERTYTVEPVEDPVPRERPAEPAEPAGPSPAEQPAEPEKVPAP